MNANIRNIIETASRHLVCGLAALVAGGIALSVAAGPVEASSTLPLKTGSTTSIIIIL